MIEVSSKNVKNKNNVNIIHQSQYEDDLFLTRDFASKHQSYRDTEVDEIQILQFLYLTSSKLKLIRFS